MSTRTSRGRGPVRFGEFELDVRAGELRREGERIRLQEQPLRILMMLLERPGDVVLREEIRKRLWPNDTVVEISHGINAAVLRLREALGESAENPRYIETVARRGYRFRAPSQSPAAVPPSDHYQLHEQLGAGGMGVVYRAEDLRLGRQVALKLLPREMAADPVALGRFHREARAASALNHPNICTIYAVEEFDGQPAIAMELLEGETLEAILARGPLPLARAIEIAIPVAAAIDAAHRKGVTHRDLKPANILVSATSVKVLDFGLAKIEGPAAVETHVTERGAVLGTLHYMSPEQAQGRDASVASDLFSFGAVLYEMIAGRRPFGGENSASVMASILKSDPPPLENAEMQRIVARCLVKDPAGRWPSAGELKAALAAVGQAPARRPKRPSRPLYLVAAAASVLALILVLYRERAPSPLPPAVSRYTLQVNANRLSLSPDGTRIAYFANGRLYIRGLNQLEGRAVEGSGGMATTPFWSPDSRFIAFASNGALKKAGTDGGFPQTLAPVHTNVAGAWGPDGTILIGVIGGGIVRIPATGGDPAPVTKVDLARNETRHLLPQFLPGGRRFLFVAAASRAGESMLYAASLDAAERTPILQLDSNALFVPARRESSSGYLLYERGGTLLAQPFDSASLRLSGQATPIANPLSSTATVGSAARVSDFSATPMTIAFRNPLPAGFVTIEQNWTAALQR